jgi:hypothetical protein
MKNARGSDKLSWKERNSSNRRIFNNGIKSNIKNDAESYRVSSRGKKGSRLDNYYEGEESFIRIEKNKKRFVSS